ncbi:MAG: UDP-N-acetylmuramoyl-tripeptide--D-alanyl-D-alanine ligase [Candidatus Limivicinus sp.]|nr:UDP-N-acetylmuramoyl-tripeptide--D-alanyl-D-alanine ligase [Clostridiales bacterium]MDY6132285.1 UDP-N-acetylmuramoyl-tripeptide--D-alanyl-D-alanine ligase [Candidatus Limivicinus sp.]
MRGMTISRAAAVCGGQLCGEGDFGAELGSVVIDSRAVSAGDFFVAYKGERVDGHDYISAAFDRGAVCCLAQRVPEGETRPVILVPDVQTALEQICAEYRRDLRLPVIGITGSVGKTSAKEMISAVLSQRLNVLKTDKNLNNQIGVPMTISRIRPEHQAAVVEMGISGFGEMSVLARIARPDMAVFTLIGHAHLEFLHDLDGVLRAKTEMLDFMADDAPVLINGDDEKLRGLQCRQKKISFGLGENCDIRAEKIMLGPKGETFCDIVYGERRIPVEIRAYGRHMIYAALEGAAVGLLMGLSDGEIVRGVASFETVGRRAAVCDTGFITLIDDSYNANPDSVKCGIDSLMKMPGRHVCILGDMLELGEGSGEMHFDVGRYAGEKGAELVLTSGPLSRETCRGAGERGRHFATREELIAALPGLIQKGDRVLVKASLGSRFDQISEALKELK